MTFPFYSIPFDYKHSLVLFECKEDQTRSRSILIAVTIVQGVGNLAVFRVTNKIRLFLNFSMYEEVRLKRFVKWATRRDMVIVSI